MGEGTLNLELARAVVAQCVVAGAAHAVISPGSRNTPVVLAIHEAAEAGHLSVHVVLDERSAGFLGIGLSRASHAPVVLSCTSGTAGAHYLPAVAEASELGLPLIIITADRPEELQGRGAPQTMPQEGLFGSFVRGAVTVAPRESCADLTPLTKGAQRGPVHYNLRFRKPLWEESAGASWSAAKQEESLVQKSVDGPLKQAVESSCRGLIVAGPREHSRDGEAERAVMDFATRAGWPVLAEPASGLRGSATVFGADAFLKRPDPGLNPDCILRIGRSPTSKAISEFLAAHGAGKTWLVEPSGRLLDGERIDPRIEASGLQPVFDSLESTNISPEWLKTWRHEERRASRALEAQDNQALWAGSMIPRIWKALAPGDLLHVASSMAIRDLGSFAVLDRQGPRVSANRGTNGIDGTLSCAIGQARASGGETTVLLGDLAFLHDQSALSLVQNTPLRVVIVDNDGGAIFEHLPIADHEAIFDRFFLTPQGSDLAAISRAHGLPVATVENLDELGEALQRPLPCVIHVRVDRRSDFQAHHKYWSALETA